MTLTKVGAHYSHVGKVRGNQEDWAGMLDDVFVVCDGMGGHEGGEVASRAAGETILAIPDDPERAFREAVWAVRDKARTLRLRGAGTTCTALVGDRLLHVGDSRAYLLRGGVLTQLTTDHTVAQALIDNGTFTPEEARESRCWHILTRCVGDKDCDPDVILLDLRAGDRLLLSTDGLHDEVEEAVLASVLGGPGDAEAIAREVVAQALAGPAPDNVTALVVLVS